MGLCYPEDLNIDPISDNGTIQTFENGGSFNPINGVYTTGNRQATQPSTSSIQGFSTLEASLAFGPGVTVSLEYDLDGPSSLYIGVGTRIDASVSNTVGIEIGDDPEGITIKADLTAGLVEGGALSGSFSPSTGALELEVGVTAVPLVT